MIELNVLKISERCQLFVNSCDAECVTNRCIQLRWSNLISKSAEYSKIMSFRYQKNPIINPDYPWTIFDSDNSSDSLNSPTSRNKSMIDTFYWIKEAFLRRKPTFNPVDKYSKAIRFWGIFWKVERSFSAWSVESYESSPEIRGMLVKVQEILVKW